MRRFDIIRQRSQFGGGFGDVQGIGRKRGKRLILPHQTPTTRSKVDRPPRGSGDERRSEMYVLSKGDLIFTGEFL
jgi:hypothetical protein